MAGPSQSKMPTKGAVIEYLANLSEAAVEELVKLAAGRRGVLVDNLVYVNLYKHIPGPSSSLWLHLRSVRCHVENVERLLERAAAAEAALQLQVIDLRQLCPPQERHRLASERCHLTLLDAAILAGDKRLVRRLMAHGVTQVFQFLDWDFLHARTLFMDDQGARRLEAASLAGIDISTIPHNLLQDECGLAQSAILGGQRKAAMLLRRHGARVSLQQGAEELLRVQWERVGPGRCYLDPACLQLAHDLGLDLKSVRINLWGAVCQAGQRQRVAENGWHISSLCDSGRLHVEAFPAVSLLEAAISLGQADLATWLASLGCDGCGITAAHLDGVRHDLHRILEWPDASIATFAEVQLAAARGIYPLMRARYHIPILQMTRWWKRVPHALAASAIVAQHVDIIGCIAEFAYSVPVWSARH